MHYLCHMECHTNVVWGYHLFLTYKGWHQQDVKFKRCARVCACAWLYTCTRTLFDFHRNPLCWDLSLVGHDNVSLSEQFLTFQRIILPLKNHEPLTQQHSITSQKTQISSSAAVRQPQILQYTSCCGVLPIPVASIAMEPHSRLQYHHAINRAQVLYHHVLPYCPQPVKHKVIHDAPVCFMSHDNAGDMRKVSLKFYIQVLFRYLVSEKCVPVLHGCKR
jgi:hypothetical protein